MILFEYRLVFFSLAESTRRTLTNIYHAPKNIVKEFLTLFSP